MAICISIGVPMLLINFKCSTRVLNRPGAVHPTREPGARVLVNESQSNTRPSLSKALAVFGRCGECESVP